MMFRDILKSLFNKNLPKIIVLCFLAPIFFHFFWLGQLLLTDLILGIHRERIYYNGVSCKQPAWTETVYFFSSKIIYLSIAIGAFILSRKAANRNNTTLLLASAFLFYPAADNWFYKLLRWFYGNPLQFIENKSFLTERMVPLFGNFYTMSWANFITGYVFGIFYLFLAYKIIFHHWGKTMRIQFFTFGFASCMAGKFFWYSFLGPLLYR
jgi:hypothetical protein